MAQIFALNLGETLTGLTDLRASLCNGSGVEQSLASTGFTELGGGQYSWTFTIPASVALVRFYSAATPATIFFTLAVRPDAEVPASTNEATKTAYLYTKNAAGVVTGAIVLSYQLVGLDAGTSGAGLDNDVHTVTSDINGLASFEAVEGGYYRYWVGNGRYRTAHITAATADPYELPDVTG